MHEWFQERKTIAELEAENMYEDRPFGYMNADWERLKAEVMDGDELWTFSTPDDYWRNLAGRAGVALVRDGVAIRQMITRMN